MDRQPLIVSIPDKFFEEHPEQRELLTKGKKRPYVEGTIVSDEMNDYFIPFRTNLPQKQLQSNPENFVTLPSANRPFAGLDIRKMIVVSSAMDIHVGERTLGSRAQFRELLAKESELWSKADDYVSHYRSEVLAGKSLSPRFQFNTLQYFHEELKLPKKQPVPNRGKLLQRQKELAKSRNILDVAGSLGMELEKAGRTYRWTEHDSLTIFPDSNTYKWFSHDKQGDVISLVQTVGNHSFKEAVAYLNDPNLQSVDLTKLQAAPSEPFKYLLKDQPLQQAKDYLINQRGLSPSTVEAFVKGKILTQATRTHTNRQTGERFSEPVAVFKSFDAQNNLVGATLQGVVENRARYTKHGYLKEIIRNSNGDYGVSVDLGKPKRLIFFESPIDMMSYFELKGPTGTINDVKLVSMNGLKESVVSQYYKDLYLSSSRTEVKPGQTYLEAFDEYITNNVENGKQKLKNLGHSVTLAVDNDEKGRQFAERLGLKNIPITVDLPPAGANGEKVDWNSHLQALKAQKAQSQAPSQSVAPKVNENRVPAVTAEPFSDARQAQMQAVADFWKAKIQQREPFSVVGKNAEGKIFRTQVFSPSVKHEGEFQWTTFDADNQPLSHKRVTEAMLNDPNVDLDFITDLPSSSNKSQFQVTYPEIRSVEATRQQQSTQPTPASPQQSEAFKQGDATSSAQQTRSKPLMADAQIHAWMEDEGLEFTEEPTEAIFILRDGSLVSGEYDMGVRGLDHNSFTTMLEEQGVSQQDPEIWSKIHDATGIVRTVSETEQALVMEGQVLSPAQEAIISQLGYEVNAYVSAPLQAPEKAGQRIDPQYTAAVMELSQSPEAIALAESQYDFKEMANLSKTEFEIGHEPSYSSMIQTAIMDGKLPLSEFEEIFKAKPKEPSIDLSPDSRRALQALSNDVETLESRAAADRVTAKMEKWEKRIQGTTELKLLRDHMANNAKTSLQISEDQKNSLVEVGRQQAIQDQINFERFKTPRGTRFGTLSLHGTPIWVTPLDEFEIPTDPEIIAATRAKHFSEAIADGLLDPKDYLSENLLNKVSRDSRDQLRELVPDAIPEPVKQLRRSANQQTENKPVQGENIKKADTPVSAQEPKKPLIQPEIKSSRPYVYFKQNGEVKCYRLQEGTAEVQIPKILNRREQGYVIVLSDELLTGAEAKSEVKKLQQEVTDAGMTPKEVQGKQAQQGQGEFHAQETQEHDSALNLKGLDTEGLAQKAIEMVRNYTADPTELAKYLEFMSVFPDRSARNVALIEAQWPGAQAVATFKQWKERGTELGLTARSLKQPVTMSTMASDAAGVKMIDNSSLSVTKGEVSKIAQLRPLLHTEIADQDANGKQRYKPDGSKMWKPLSRATPEEKAAAKAHKIETRKVQLIDKKTGRPRFKEYHVFDITQTNLAPEAYPKLMPNRKFNFDVDKVPGRKMLEGLHEYAKAIGVPVKVDHNDTLGNAKGAFEIFHNLKGEDGKLLGRFEPTSNMILLNPRNNLGQNIATLAHELAHATLHNPKLDEVGSKLPRERMELEAELTSYVVSKRFGLNTAEKAVPYMADWTKNLSTLSDAELSQSMKRASETAKKLIGTIEVATPAKPSLARNLNQTLKPTTPPKNMKR